MKLNLVAHIHYTKHLLEYENNSFLDDVDTNQRTQAALEYQWLAHHDIEL